MTSIFSFTSKVDGVDDHLAAHVNSLQGAVDVLAGAPVGTMFNGKLSVTVSSNAITVAIKTLADADPSASDPVIFRVGNTLRMLTTALSVTKAAGTNWFNSGSTELATNAIDYFVYIIWDTVPATDELDIGFARIPYAITTNDFNATTTNPKYVATGNSSSLTSSNECSVIGRFNAVLSATASFNWSIPATQIIINRPIYATRWLTWTASPTGFTGGDPFNVVTYYKIEGETLYWMLNPNGDTGTSNATTSTIVLPFVPAAISALNNWSVGRGQDNATECSPVFKATQNSTTMDVYKGPGQTAWTNSGTKFYSGQGFYRIE